MIYVLWNTEFEGNYDVLIYLCVWVLTAYISVHHVCVVSTETKRKHQILLELELSSAVYHHAGNQIQVLCKSSWCFKLLELSPLAQENVFSNP